MPGLAFAVRDARMEQQILSPIRERRWVCATGRSEWENSAMRAGPQTGAVKD
jgi:hypothetical protein